MEEVSAVPVLQPTAAAPSSPVSLGPPPSPFQGGKRRKRERKEEGEGEKRSRREEKEEGEGGKRSRREEKEEGGRNGPEFVYTLSSTTKYHVLLDQTAGMGRQDRWTNVKRALFRFIDLLPVGSRLNMIAFGETTREVLPTTTVTELNRDGLFGRIPRR